MQEDFGLDLSGKISYVYFFRLGEDGPIKIGYTKRIRRRLSVVQVDNPCVVRLISVIEGGRKEEFALHKKFESYRLYGEWFSPEKELIDFIYSFPVLDLVAADFQKPRPRGPDCYNWKGEEACSASKNQRAKAYTRYKKRCDRCKLGKGIDSIYKDGNKDNLDPDNIVFYCRRCRMELDGTIEIIKEIHRQKKFRECKVCGKITNRFWYDRCNSCNEFFRRNGFERSEKREGKKDSVNCIICNDLVSKPAKGKCHTCYEFFRKNGFERSVILSEMNNENSDIEKLKSFNVKMNFEKARLIRLLFSTGMYTRDFLVEKSNISKSYLADILSNRYFIDDDYHFTKASESRRVSCS